MYGIETVIRAGGPLERAALGGFWVGDRVVGLVVRSCGVVDLLAGVVAGWRGRGLFCMFDGWEEGDRGAVSLMRGATLGCFVVFLHSQHPRVLPLCG